MKVIVEGFAQFSRDLRNCVVSTTPSDVINIEYNACPATPETIASGTAQNLVCGNFHFPRFMQATLDGVKYIAGSMTAAAAAAAADVLDEDVKAFDLTTTTC